MIKPFIYKGVCCIMKENDNDNTYIKFIDIDYKLNENIMILYIL